MYWLPLEQLLDSEVDRVFFQMHRAIEDILVFRIETIVIVTLLFIKLCFQIFKEVDIWII